MQENKLDANEKKEDRNIKNNDVAIAQKGDDV